ncbi:MAG: tRNA (adenosine(37)-N6)-threonylcarbamoyltransferase complex ATPase subunit type 1 TsaE [Treponema sp.]|jgi:tRNA threonylcarbamoyladenosine biosynthesis protein TsaE|nr:tRNA (adenosine(37)-N6)-threonylcarbamoyltransferase complex ATPase subunit type 1 TsaE [Treponema sp.]
MTVPYLFESLSTTPQQTIAIGALFAQQQLKRNAVVALHGALGAGKTYFTKGIARGIGIHEEITSPTFNIVIEYDGVIPLYHIDAYRLANEADFYNLGVEERIYGNGITVIEWSERIHGVIPRDAFLVNIAIVDSQTRKITVTGGPTSDYSCV